MHQAKRNGVPFSIINARLSNRSYNRLRRLGIFQKFLIPENLHILASSEKQCDRWKNIGVDSNNILSMGNLKVDISPLNPPSLTQKNDRKKELGFPPSALVLVGISTWPGEEKLLLEALEQIRASKIDARLLLIPRHVERRNEILNTLSSFAFSFRQRTQPQQNKIECLVYFADTTGELIDLIECADIAFLGKTLPPRHEGQNPIEPISMGLPLIIGPACTNFSETCDDLLARGAVKQGHSNEQVKKILVSLIHNEDQKAKMNKAGLNWRNEQGSPTQKTVNQLKKFYRS
jgi:3-deoxy-D-manno-octulosonic-acid transferase